MSGLVSIVGAGPGDPDLITQKGVDRLTKAEVLLHDKLSPNKLIEDFCPPDTRIHDVGKRKGKVGPDQKTINRMLLEAAQDNHRVVRLKGGDPFLFGRGGEETEFLAEHDVNFEIIPGVSSLTAVPAYAGIPLTHRDYSSSVGVITGHFNRESSGEKHDWKSLAKLETLVVMMGITRVGSIVQNLIEAGKQPQTPAALVGWGATPKQQSIITTIDSLRDGLDDPSPYLPGLIIIGDVVKCRSQLNWYETKPLHGRKIIVTRPESQSDRLIGRLQDAGARTYHCPTIQITPLNEGLSELRDQFSELSGFDWAVFTSRNAVRFFFGALDESGKDVRALGNLEIAGIGPGTAQRLEQEGIKTDLVPSKNRAEALTEELLDVLEPKSKVLLPRSAGARAHLADELSSADHEVREISLYETSLPGEDERQRLKQLLFDSSVDMITFTSSSTVENLFEAFDERTIKPQLDRMARAVIGPITAQTLESHGVSPSFIPDNYNLEVFYRSIVEYFQGSDYSSQP